MRKHCLFAWPLTGVLALALSGASARAENAPPPAAPAAPGAPAQADPFTALCEKIQKNPEASDDNEVKGMLETAAKTGRPMLASMAVKQYLRRHTSPSPALLLAAAENAELAGDYRMAVTRYKTYLGAPESAELASSAATHMYVLLIDFLHSDREAYEFMRNADEHQVRQSQFAKRFDVWFLEIARSSNDSVAASRRLVSIFSEKMPLEKERMLYWDYLMWAQNDVLRPNAEKFPAAPHLAALVPLIRENKNVALRCALSAAMVNFYAQSAGKDKEAQKPLFAPAIKAAQDYFDNAPNQATLRDIINTFTMGDGNIWNMQLESKQAFFIAAFEKLSDAEKTEMIGPFGGHATPDQWVALILKNPQPYKAMPQFRALNLLSNSLTAETCKKLGEALQGVPSYSAAIINSVNASNLDMDAAAAHILKNESWYASNPSEVMSWLRNNVWSLNNTIAQAQKKPYPGDYFDRFIARVGAELITSTPVAWTDAGQTGDYLRASWNYSGADVNDHSKFAALLHSVDWVSYNAQQRQQAYTPALNEFRRWAEEVKKDPKRLAAEKATMELLEKTFQEVMADHAGDPAKAPNALCKNLSQLSLAVTAKDVNAYTAAARSLYAMVKDYNTAHTPWGKFIYGMLLDNRLEQLDTLDFQCEVLADQLTKADAAPNQERIAEWSNHATRRPNWQWWSWNWWQAAQPDADKARKIRAVIEKPLLQAIEAGTLWPEVFTLYRSTRQGPNWNDPDSGAEVIEKLIAKKTFFKAHYREEGWVRCDTTSYPWLIQREFQKQEPKFPVGNFFDDMYLEEETGAKYLDYSYFNFGRDEKHKVRNLGAQFFKDFERLPFGFSDKTPVYTPDDFWRWQYQALEAEPAPRDAFIAQIETTYGKTRFDDYAAGRGFFTHQAHGETPETRKAFFERLNQFLARIRESGDRGGFANERTMAGQLPPMHGLARMQPPKFSKEELDTLVSIFPQCVPRYWNGGQNYEWLIPDMIEGLAQAKRELELFPLAGHLWKIALDTGNGDFQHRLAQYTVKFQEEKQTELATVFAIAGLEVIGDKLPEDVRATLQAIRSKGMGALGHTIPVAANDPRYPIFFAQNEFLVGKQQSAWESYQAQPALVLSAYKELDINFLLWLVTRNTDAGQYDRSEALAHLLIPFVEGSPGAFDAEAHARLLLYYADIAFARQVYPRARKDYERITVNKEYDGTQAQREAELRVAEVDRAVFDYDAALARLDRLSRRHDSYLETEANFQMAQVKFDQGDYDASLHYLETVFARSPNHPRGRLLEGDVNLKRLRPDRAVHLKVGASEDQKYLVPGSPLKINLEDINLSTVGTSASIEVHVWTESGDSEVLHLLTTEESKTQFEGELVTKMGPVHIDDHVLQVLGNDKVYYDYSDKFKQEHKIVGNAALMLEVASNATLAVSSGKILSKEEEEDLDADRQIRRTLQGEDPQTSLSTTRAQDQIKPGNSITTRVTDFDRNISAQKDTVTVRVAASSGDVIEAFPLVETETHSGVFEAEIPTAPGHATATATDSDEGREPNNVISSVDRPAWIGLPDNRRPKLFTVNLNDNVVMQSLNVVADVPDRKLKAFAVETSMNGIDFNTVGMWPEQVTSWDGSLQYDIVKCAEGPAKLQDAVQYAASGYIRSGAPKITVPLKTFGVTMGDNALNGNAEKIKLSWDGPTAYYLVHMHGAFSLAKRENKTFKLDTKNRVDQMRYFFAVDGTSDPKPYEIKRTLARGVHQVDVYLWTHRHTGANFEVLMGSEEDNAPSLCKAEMFDPVKQPEIKAACWVEPAQVKPNAEKTAFDIDFAKGTHARFLRLNLADFEKDAPALHKLKLINSENQTVLPTKDDYMALRENKVLEILPGDKITVTYRDPKVVTKGQEVHEKFMTSTFYNAKLSACFVEYVPTARGDRVPRYIPLRRFKPGDNINIFINDPDEDTTDGMDKVKITAVAGKSKVEIEAIETEPHSGVFVGNIFPVLGQPKRPNDIVVGPEDDITITYMDKENTDPGIPWARTFIVEQSISQAPRLAIFDVDSQPLNPDELKTAQAAEEISRRVAELIPATTKLIVHRPDAPHPDPAHIFSDGPLVVELSYPSLAQSPNSLATIYVQTASGREKFKTPVNGFDENVPGTLKITRRPDPIWWRLEPPPGYQSVFIRDQKTGEELLSDGKFIFHVPMELAEVPADSLIGYIPPEDVNAKPLTLSVRGNDTVFVGFKVDGPNNQPKWVVQEAKLVSEPRFHVMNNRYQEILKGAHVGDNLYFRVIHKTMDTTRARDSVTINLETKAGKKQTLALSETFAHSGVFKGTIKLAYVGDKEGAAEAGVLPVDYGDTVTAQYAVEGLKEPLASTLEIYKGSDGKVLPFTRRFKDLNLAVQTQFTIAESYFELAKQHRALNRVDDARQEMAEGKKLLEEAIRDYPRDESKVEAEYLLAELSLEVAEDTNDEELKHKHYTEAQIRYSEIVTSYPASDRAPWAQYKKALIYEKLNMMDQACEEYVKLSCRYPKHDLVCDTIAQLGDYFRKKAIEIETQATAQQDPIQAEKLHQQASLAYITAAEVFASLAVKNPGHRLAAPTTLMAADCYRSAEKWDKALAQYKVLVDSPAPNPELAPQAMYWSGICMMAKNEDLGAYHMFKNLVWKFPSSAEAKKAKGKMYEDRLLEAEKKESKD